MTDLDEALAANPAAIETAVSTATVRKCGRHRFAPVWHDDGVTATVIGHRCMSCGKTQDPVASRRGRSSRRLGNDQERRAEKRYGWEKIGERGEKTDLRGRFAKVQQKATRRPAPALFRDTFAGLDATQDGRIPLLLLTYVQPRGTEDFIVMRGSDWLALHGVDTLEETHD